MQHCTARETDTSWKPHSCSSDGARREIRWPCAPLPAASEAEFVFHSLLLMTTGPLQTRKQKHQSRRCKKLIITPTTIIITITQQPSICQSASSSLSLCSDRDKMGRRLHLKQRLLGQSRFCFLADSGYCIVWAIIC